LPHRQFHLNPPHQASAVRAGVRRCLSRLVLAATLVSLTGCVPAARRASGWVFPLPRHQPNDGLAVVSLPGGAGLHLWLDTDTSEAGRCSPRWNPDAARLRGGNGPTPTSGGRAARQEFYAAMARGSVRWQLRRQFAALCRQRAPQSRFVWQEPPRRAEDFQSRAYPMVEGRNLLSNPKAVLRAEKRLLGQPIKPEDFENEEPAPEPPGP
jgi:hypothetical protein